MDSPRPGSESLPERIGDFRILRKLGEGGMGVVFEAEQDHPRRAVALKVLSTGVLSQEMRRRFEREAQVLGRLQHPAIAQIHAAGLFEGAGGPQPFFAMELIRGEPLGIHAKKRELGTRERLELVARICDGIQHAHQRGVIHRDLKPENILVDEAGQPKILDFGIARATDADIQAATLRTDLGQIIGTVQYMSPEQAAGDPARIDARTDIYSLGVVAYQLVSGALPYKSDDPLLLEALRVVREEDPRPASTANRSLRGDVETILGKALEKDLGRRYASAAEFAADIRRWLNDEPIRARAPSAMYQLRKFTRRNKALVLGLAGIFAALVVGLLGTLRGYFHAQDEAARANQTSAFLRTILAGVDPAVAQGSDTTLLKSILDDTAARVGDELAGLPLAEAEIRSTIMSTYYTISAYEPALVQARAAVAIWSRELGDDHPLTLDERRKEGAVLEQLGRYAEAEEVLRSTLARSEQVLGPDDPVTVNLSCEIGVLCMELGDYQEALARLEPALEFRRRVRGPDDDLSLIALNSLGVIDLHLGRFAEATEILREALERWTRVKGDNHPETIKVTMNLASSYAQSGRLAEAEALARDVLERNLRILGEDHENTHTTMTVLGQWLRDQGRYDEAIGLLERTVASQRRTCGLEDPRVFDTESKLADILHEASRQQEAEQLAWHSYEGRKRFYGEDHPETLHSLSVLGAILEGVESPERVAELRRKTLEGMTRTLGVDHPETLMAENDLAVSYLLQQRYAESEPLAREALAIRRRRLGDEHRSTLQSIDTVATICRETQRWQESVPLFGEMLAGWSRLYGDENLHTVDAADSLGEGLDHLTSLADAEPALRALLAYHERNLPPDAPRIGIDLALLARALAELGRPSEAVEFCERAEPILLAAFERSLDGPDAERSELARRIADLYEAWGRPEDAAGWRE